MLFSCSKKQPNLNNKGLGTKIEGPALPTSEQLLNNYSPEDITKPIDIDMTKMSATMIYAQVFDMVIMPEEFIGKKIKVTGNFQVFINDSTKERYFSILIPDATACCQQGIDFVWLGNHSFPTDYPEQNQEITVTGIFSSIETDEGLTFNYLIVSDLIY